MRGGKVSVMANAGVPRRLVVTLFAAFFLDRCGGGGRSVAGKGAHNGDAGVGLQL